MTALEVSQSMDRAIDDLHRRQGRPSFTLAEGRRLVRSRPWGWALFVVSNGRPRKVGATRSEAGLRSFLRGGVW